jgi:hypothetical protein
MDRLKVPPVVYDDDFALWIERQVGLLRARQFDQLDIEIIAEELDSMGRSDRRELAHRLEVLTAHLLKCQFQPRRKSHSWLSTLGTQRRGLERLIEESPSLRPTVLSVAQKIYRHAVCAAHEQTRLPKSAFPAALPYSAEQLLDDDFVP